MHVTDTLLPLDYLAKSSLEGEIFLSCGENEKLISLEDVFVNNIFDPYYGLDRVTLQKLFTEATSNSTVRANYLRTIADLMYRASFEIVNSGDKITLQFKLHSEFSECLQN